jgi:hypothetical protein
MLFQKWQNCRTDQPLGMGVSVYDDRGTQQSADLEHKGWPGEKGEIEAVIKRVLSEIKVFAKR